MKKRILKIFILLVILIILVGVTFFIIDYNRVKNHKEPIFAIKTLIYNDGGTKEYFCFGYKVIDFRKLDYINFTKIGPLWMKYEDFEKITESIEPTTINGKNIKDLPENINIEYAINEGYFVIANNGIYNKNILDKFIKNTEMNAENRIEDSIRIIVYNASNYPTVYDLEYKIFDEIDMNGNKKSGYILTTDNTRSYMSAEGYVEGIITTNMDIPGEYYGISLIEYPGVNAVSIRLTLNNEKDFNNLDINKYKTIEITRYLMNYNF